MSTTITIQTEGRRTYITGDTYPHRDSLRSAGAHWDGDRRAWWLGDAKRAAALAEQLGGTGADSGDRKGPGTSAIVAGRGEYKGKTYYLAGRSGRDGDVRVIETRDGGKVLLYARDGSFQFWADRDAVSIVKIYASAAKISALRNYAARMKSRRDSGDDSCQTCERNFASGRWAPYCGSGDYDDCRSCGATVQIRY